MGINGPNNPGDRAPKVPDNWADIEKDPKFQRVFMDVLEEAIMNKKFGEDFMEQYTRSLITRSLEDTKSVKYPKDGTEFEKMYEADPKFREMVDKSFDKEDQNPIVPEVAAMEESMRLAKTKNDLLEIAKDEGVILTPEEISEARDDALRLWITDPRK